MAERGSELIRVESLSKHFQARGAGLGGRAGRVVRAVDGVSLSIRAGETFGLVGESGCGKSTLGRCVARLLDASSGSVLYGGTDITRLPERSMKEFRRRMQIIFQDPYSSLNPFMTVGEIVAEPMEIHLALSRSERDARVAHFLEKVGLPASDAAKFPHEFSGGQRQRIGIARALSVDPEFVLCDEPISALDVSIQAQIVNVLEELQAELGLTYLFIAHNLLAVRHISDRIGVMYLGKLVEVCESRELFSSPLHPYTKALIASIPVPDPAAPRIIGRERLSGELPSPLDLPSGCRFRTRCPLAATRCAEAEPQLREAGFGHAVACHFA
jgi:oligopeptide/dipeptide ABC transporter ATP-binding protein